MKKLKKILLVLVVLAVVLGIAAIVLAGVFLNKIVKTGIETVAPPITQTSVTVSSVSISALSGAAGINGFVIGNPTGYTSSNAISLGKASVRVEPKSVLDEKVIIRDVEIRAPEITFEGNPFGKNNLSQILDNVKAASGPADTSKPAAKPAGGSSGSGKKLQLDHFVMSGVKVTAIVSGLESQPFSVTIPDIEFSNLGTGPEGITAAELTQKILEKVSAESIETVGKRCKEIASETANNLIKGATENAGKAVNDGAKKLEKGLNNLLGK